MYKARPTLPFKKPYPASGIERQYGPDMRATLIRLVATTCLILGSSTMAAHAITTVFDNQQTFLSGLGSYIVDDFESAGYRDPRFPGGVDIHNLTDAAMSGVLGETSYSATRWSNSNTVYRQSDTDNFWYCAGCNGTFLLDFTSTSVGTANGVFGVGFDVAANSSGDFAYVAYVTFGDGSVENFALPSFGALAGDETFPFWGITSDHLISSTHIGLKNGVATNFGQFIMDDLSIGSAPVAAVPEPSTAILLCLGILALCVLSVTVRRQARFASAHRFRGRP
jgi:hypothetical protein